MVKLIILQFVKSVKRFLLGKGHGVELEGRSCLERHEQNDEFE